MAPVYAALRTSDRLVPVLLASGQHRDLLCSALSTFDLHPDFHLDVMQAGQTPNQVAAAILQRLPALLDEVRPAAVLVQGDTTTVLAAGISALHAGIPLGHVEAGLRTGDLQDPFPEEANRQLVDRISRWCFVPTDSARNNLLAEGIPAARIHLTGNTAVDALLWASDRVSGSPDGGSILLTLHRRESFGAPMGAILAAVAGFLDEVPEAHCIWPVHPNPEVQNIARRHTHPRIRQIRPLGYLDFVSALRSCRFVITDSGGIQEEAPSLGKRVLVVRDSSERPEAIHFGRNSLVGRGGKQVGEALHAAWGEPPYAGPIPAPNPYGDGIAGQRIADVLASSI